MGLGDLYPGEEAIACLEAINMTCEWDITPFFLTAIFDALARENPLVNFPADLLAACDYVRDSHLNTPKLNLENLPAILGKHFKPGMEYATLAYELNQPGVPEPPFPHLVGNSLLKALLCDTRLLNGAFTTRVFQHYTLGSERCEKLCSLPSLFESDSYLFKYDRVLLSDEKREALLHKWTVKQLGVAVYTARPSQPEKTGAPTYNYSPEAEVALEALRLVDLPLVGAGKMGWLATELGLRVDQLTKPSPVQALAAIAAALTRQTEPALRAAAAFHFEGKAEFFHAFPPLSIHVFEDSGGNAAAVHSAVEELQKAVVPCRFTAWGIGENPAKQQALLAAGATLVPEINQAIRMALAIEGLSTKENNNL